MLDVKQLTHEYGAKHEVNSYIMIFNFRLNKIKSRKYKREFF